MKVLIDTCIILDVLQHREPFFDDSLRVMHFASDKDFIGIITAKSVTDIFYILRRSLHDENEARRNVRKLFTLFEIADTFALDCELALYSATKDYEDAVMIETARRIAADYIVTRNLKDYTNSEIPVYSPKAFLETLSGN